MCWFDERPSWLGGVVSGLHKAGCSHVVAVDGAYGLYQNGRAYSSREQHGVIVEVCQALEMGCTIYAPQEPFIDNEIEKRTMSLRLAEAVAEPFKDWYLVVDADHFITSAIGHLHRLEETDCDTAEVRFMEPYGAVPSGGCPLRCVFRAIPGMFYDRNHYSPTTPDGRNLHDGRTPALDLSCLEVEHRTGDRDRYRRELQVNYYKRRDISNVEVPH